MSDPKFCQSGNLCHHWVRVEELLRDAYDIIAALDDPDCKHWLSQAQAILEPKEF